MSPLLVNMSFRVSKSLRYHFSLTAQKNDRNVSQLLRDYMREYIEQHRETWFEEKADLEMELANRNADPVQSAAAKAEIAAAKEEVIRTERLKYRLRLIRPKKVLM